MPCNDGGYPRERASVPVHVFCEVVNLILEYSPALFNQLSDEARTVFVAHDSDEKERVKREALDKLSNREKIALGLPTSAKPVRKTSFSKNKKPKRAYKRAG